MLYGKELVDAISAALSQNGKTQADAARKLGVKPPSVTGWIKTGRIGKSKLIDLIRWLDQTPLEHWDIQALPGYVVRDVTESKHVRMPNPSPKALAVIEMLKEAANNHALTDNDWDLIWNLSMRLAHFTHALAYMPPTIDPAYTADVDRQIHLAEQRKKNDSQTSNQQRRKAAKG